MSSENNWFRRDSLIETERKIQAEWKLKSIIATRRDGRKKFFVTFPYPYMNGKLHLGHAYTISKAEFISRFMELFGYNVMFPFGFHGSGMPIVSCANKLKEEIVKYNFDNVNIPENMINPEKTQIMILYKMGVPISEISLFTDPYYWIKYFPVRAQEDLEKFGVNVDFKKSFMTTDLNPYYDSFVKWQFDKLHKSGKLSFGKKPIIFSPKDNQPCADHDRSVGEGVGIKESFLIKLRIIDSESNNQNKYMIVPTTHVETLFNPVTLQVNPNHDFIEFTIGDDPDHYISTEQIMNNFRYQYTKDLDNIPSINVIKLIRGQDLITNQVEIQFIQKSIPIEEIPHYSPYLTENAHFCEPFYNISDFTFWQKQKRAFDDSRIKIPDMNIYEHIEKGIKSCSGKKEALIEFQNNFHKLMFETGIIAEMNNMSCTKARSEITNEILNSNHGFKFYEPEALVISRSGDTCVVAICDQWFINYGEVGWKARVNAYISENLQTFNNQVKSNFMNGSDWLKEWPCSRSYGLGTRLLDTEYLIDSLSDSTIYMAFYTVCDIMSEIPPELITNEVWDFIYLKGDFPSNITDEYHVKLLNEMRNEFEYWYPLDLRVSGKDLISNHLTMSLYNHAAIWSTPDMYPKAFFANGHVMLNGKKMSKSEGIFMTLDEAITKYGADATRITLAEAGSGIDDANFNEKNANAAILKLTTERDWCKEIINKLAKENSINSDNDNGNNFWDIVFESEMNVIIKQSITLFENLDFQKAIVMAFYNLMGARDNYRLKYENGTVSMNQNLMKRYLEVHLALIYPFCPHYAEDLWAYSENNGFVLVKKQFPEITNINYKVLWQKDSIDRCFNDIRTEVEKLISRQKKNPKICDPNNITVEVLTYNFADREMNIIDRIRSLINQDLRKDQIIEIITNDIDKKEMGFYKQFINFIFANIESYSKEFLSFCTEPDDLALLRIWLPEILSKDKIHILNIESFDEFNKSNKSSKLGSKNHVGPWYPSIIVH